MGNIYGYVRVSSREQNEARQIIAMHEMKISDANIFIDKQSGKNFDRPQYKRLLRRIRPDDLICIKSIDRLGRNYAEMIEQWRIITKEKHADICVMDMPLLDTRRDKDLLGTFISDLVLALLSYMSESERKNIRQRQAEGIAAAKKRGVHCGRFPKPLPDNFEKEVWLWKMKKISVTEAAKRCGMPRTTFYEKARKYEKDLGKIGK